MTRLEWSIAWRYLRSRRDSPLLSFISMIAIGGVVVGVSALVVTLGVINGLQVDLRDKILLGSPDIRLLSDGSKNLRMPDWRSVLDSVRMQKGVVAAQPFVLTEAMARNSDGFVQVVHVQGIPAESPSAPNVTGIRQKAIEGNFKFVSAESRLPGAVLGQLLALRLNARVGDTVKLITAGSMGGDAVFGGIVPTVRDFVVSGVFSTEMYEYDYFGVYVNIDIARELAGLGNDVTGIEIKTTSRWDAPAVATRVERALGGFPYRTEDWTQQNSSLFRALRLEKLAMTVILLLIVLVAAFNIVGTLSMVVRDKTREIGILKAMGFRSKAVRNVFMLQGLVIGLVGTTGGIALGGALALALDRYRLIKLDPQIYFIDHLPVSVQVVDTALIVVASVAIAIIATLYPARQAARLFPVEAIRSE
jgi:lipoprotein-releasing system permease protein